MRFLLFIFSLNLCAYDFKSYEAKFEFHANGLKFDLKRYFIASNNQINTRVKMDVFFYTYSLDSTFLIEDNKVISLNSYVKDPFKKDPKKFWLNFDENGVSSKKLGYFPYEKRVVEQLASDVQVRLNAVNGVHEYSLNIFDNTKAKVIEKNYKFVGTEEVKTSFGLFEALVVEATAEEVGPITYYISPELDYLIIKSTAILKNGDKRTLLLKEMPKFLAK